MRIVLDTNVLVSGLLSPFGPPGEIVRMAASGALQFCYDARIISEYRRVLLRPKFPFNPDRVNALLDVIEKSGHVVAPYPLQNPLPDLNDEPFLEVAIAGQARCLVTGTLGHYTEESCQAIRVLSPAELLEVYRQEA